MREGNVFSGVCPSTGVPRLGPGQDGAGGRVPWLGPGQEWVPQLGPGQDRGYPS